MNKNDSDSEHGNYVLDTAYPAHFQREAMPIWLSSTLTALGRSAPDIQSPFTWLELGCGAGLSTVVAAATYPQGRFIGVDLSEREIAHACRLATDASLDNVEFICADFLQVEATLRNENSSPDCDFIVVNGVYSWVNESIHQAIDSIIELRLRPGGIAFISYLSHPGAASFAAAHQLMLMTTPGHPGDSAAKARNAMNLLHVLDRSGAGYFVEHPAAKRDMDHASALSDAYLAHEFLNKERHVLHVSDMMSRYTAKGCEWVGSARTSDNIDAVSLPHNMLAVITQLQQQGADIALLETVRDIARNQNLRLDIFQKRAIEPHGNRLTEQQHRAALLAQRITLQPHGEAGLRQQGDLTLNTRIGTVAMSRQNVLPLLRALQQRPHSYAELARLPAYASEPGLINQLLQVLAWEGWVHFLPEFPIQPSIQARAQRLQQALDQAGHEQVRVQADTKSALVYI